MRHFIVGLTVVLLGIVVVLKWNQRKNKDDGRPADKGLVVESLLNVILAVPLYQYYSTNNTFPRTQEEFIVEVNKVQVENGNVPLPGIPDPWGNPIIYIFPGKVNVDGYDLLSYGEDGVKSADDIINHFVADVWPPPVTK